MNIYAILPLCATILNLFLVIFILTKGEKKQLNMAFAILSFSVMVWNFGYFLMYIAPSKDFAFLFARQVMFFGTVFLPPTFLLFIMVLIDKFTKQTKILYLSAYIFSLTLYLLYFDGFTTNNVIRYSWG